MSQKARSDFKPQAPSKSLESWIWDAACSIRGAKGAQNGAVRPRSPAKAARRVSAAVRVKYSRTERDRLPKATRRASVTDDILPLIFTKRLCEFDHNLALSKIPKDEAFNRAADFYLRFTGLHSHTESIAA